MIGVYPETKHPTYFAAKAAASMARRSHVARRQVGGDAGGRRLHRSQPRLHPELRGRVLDQVAADHARGRRRFPLVQLYDDFHSAKPYDMAYNLAHGADLAQAIYGGLCAGPWWHRQHHALRWACHRAGAALDEGQLRLRASARGKSICYRAPLDPKVDIDGDGKAELRRAIRTHAPDARLRAESGPAGASVHAACGETYLAQTPGGVAQSVIGEAVQLYGFACGLLHRPAGPGRGGARDLPRDARRSHRLRITAQDSETPPGSLRAAFCFQRCSTFFGAMDHSGDSAPAAAASSAPARPDHAS